MNTPKTTVQYIKINANFAGQRIDNFLMTYLKQVPKSRIYRLLRKGEVRINKKRIQPEYRLQAEDELRLPPLFLQEKKQIVPSERLLNLLLETILYEDEQLLIINKPAGLAVHAGSGVNTGVIETLRLKYPSLGLAHRIDRETSGCLILAKSRQTLNALHELFREGKVTKMYWALTKGHWKKNECKVEVSLRKNQLESGERIVKVDEEGKASFTVFKPMQEWADCSFVEITLHTGRMHQIRVHAQYRGHPLAGDEKYGDKEFNRKMRKLGLKRLFLHARSVEFTLSTTGKHIKVEAELDDGLKNLTVRMQPA